MSGQEGPTAVPNVLLKNGSSADGRERERIAFALEAASLVAWEWDPDTDAVIQSNNSVAVLGQSVRTGKEFFALIHPEDRDRVTRSVQRALARGNDYHEEFRIVRADGIVIWVTDQGRLVPVPGGGQRLSGAIMDITERKQAEIALARSEAMLRLAQRGGGVGVFDWDLVTFRSRCSPVFFEIYGLDPGTGRMSPEIWEKHVHPDDIGSLREHLERAVAGLEPCRADYRIVRPDGELRWVNYSGQLLHDQTGKAVRMVGAVTDITDRKRTEESLREREAMLTSLGDNLPGAIYQAVQVPGGRTKFRYFSAGIERLIGLTPADIVAEADRLYSLIEPEDLPRVLAAEEEAAATGQPFDCEFRQRTTLGELRWVQCRSARRSLADGTCVWDGVVLDVTERKRAAQDLDRYRLLSQHARDIVLFLATDGHIVEANNAAVAAYGYDRDTLLSLTIFDLRDPETARQVPAQMFAADEGGLTFETRHRRRDGLTFPVEVSSRGADILGRRLLLSIIRDISERKRLEADLLRHAEQLAEADQRKDEFLAMLAHELRNPLAPIRNAWQVLRLKDQADPDLRWAADTIGRQVSQLTRLVDDLLDVSRITRGKIELRKEWVDLAGVVERAVEMCRPAIEAARHRLTVNLPAGPVTLEADATRLAQVLGNLLNNSAKYTAEGGHIELTAARHAGGVEISVRDNGAGIPTDMLARIFELFTQVDTTLERAQGGLGIGLTIARRLMEMHGGSIRADSAGVGRGSTFTLMLPLPDSDIGSPARTPPAKPATPFADGLRILIVDDNRDSADSLAKLLAMRGHDARATYDGAAGLKAARDQHPDLILLDLGMPGLSGLDVARRLRERPETATAILAAITGWGQEEDRRRTREAGFDHHLVKPIDLDLLDQILADLFGRKAASKPEPR
jgi:PAS domain S-box-containing protein